MWGRAERWKNKREEGGEIFQRLGVGGGMRIGGGESDGEAGSGSGDDGSNLIVEKLSPLNCASPAPSGGLLVGVGSAEKGVDEFTGAGRDATKRSKDEGDERAPLIDAACAVVRVFLFFARKEQGFVVARGVFAPGG